MVESAVFEDIVRTPRHHSRSAPDPNKLDRQIEQYCSLVDKERTRVAKKAIERQVPASEVAINLKPCVRGLENKLRADFEQDVRSDASLDDIRKTILQARGNQPVSAPSEVEAELEVSRSD